MDYDIAGAFEDIEMALIKSMRNNMQRHIKEEYDEGINWTQWQAEMLHGLSQYRAENQDVLKDYMRRINAELDAAIRDAYATGESELEIELLKAIKKGYEAPKDGTKANMQGRFFRNNQKKLNALVKATTNDMKKAETALLRMTDDVYRKTLFKAQMFYNTGAGNMWQCVDMATKDFLASGINCVQYKNGARVNIASYAEMALRTANKRANLIGQANFREKYGIHTVKVNARGIACPMCLQWLDRVYIDDVYGGGTSEESMKSGYPLLSTAVQGGLYHPNCKDSCSTYYEGISREPQEITKEQESEIKRKYDLEQKQRYYERNYKRNMRLGNGCLDQQDAKIYFERAGQYKSKLIELCDNNSDVLRLDKARLSLCGVLSVDNAGRISITPKSTRTSQEINTHGRKTVWSDWDKYRQKYFKNAVSISEIDLDNPNIAYDTFDISILNDVNTQNKIVDTVQGLGQKYYSPLTTVRTMKKEDALGNSAFATTWHQWGYGTAKIELNPLKLNEKGIKRIYELSEIGYSVKIPKGKEIEYVITHEYGHSILNIGEILPSKSRNFVQADFTDIKKARKEIEEIFGRYATEVSQHQKEYDEISKKLDTKFIFECVAPTDDERETLKKAKEKLEAVKISKYSLTNIDEFTAEAFADVEIGEKPSEYSKEVHAVITKYFGKGNK